VRRRFTGRELLHIEQKLGNRATGFPAAKCSGRIGRALVREPAVYLMDEPLLAGCQASCGITPRAQAHPARAGNDDLYVTHDRSRP